MEGVKLCRPFRHRMISQEINLRTTQSSNGTLASMIAAETAFAMVCGRCTIVASSTAWPIICRSREGTSTVSCVGLKRVASRTRAALSSKDISGLYSVSSLHRSVGLPSCEKFQKLGVDEVDSCANVAQGVTARRDPILDTSRSPPCCPITGRWSEAREWCAVTSGSKVRAWVKCRWTGECLWQKWQQPHDYTSDMFHCV